jgi:dihydrofolate synthase/folylpolyglutamate synthase
MTYQRTVQRLLELQKFGIKLGLSSTENLLARLGRPDRDVPCIHIAGTNGKGSVGATVTRALSLAGYRVGFYTSPHLVSFRERFVIGPKMISQRRVVALAEQVWEVVAQEEPPTFFEFVTAMAFLYFAKEKVDLSVLETGMGGRLDATNVARPLVGVITNIGLEHTEYLGRTLAEIAYEKAGIIKPGLRVVTGESRKRIRAIFEETTRRMGGRLICLGREVRVRRRPGGRFDYQGLSLKLKDLKPGLLGPHQARNQALALAALELLKDDGFSITEAQLREGLASVVWPGRAEMFPGPPDLMLDGAHNPPGARALARTIEDLGRQGVHLVLGIMADKDIEHVMAPLLPVARALYLTRPVYERAAEPARLAEAAKAFRGPVKVIPTLPEAIEAARAAAKKNELVLITGSLFTVGEARAYLTGVSDL